MRARMFARPDAGDRRLLWGAGWISCRSRDIGADPYLRDLLFSIGFADRVRGACAGRGTDAAHECPGQRGCIVMAAALTVWTPAARSTSVRTLSPGSSLRGDVSDASTLVNGPLRIPIVPCTVSDCCRLAAAWPARCQSGIDWNKL